MEVPSGSQTPHPRRLMRQPAGPERGRSNPSPVSRPLVRARGASHPLPSERGEQVLRASMRAVKGARARGKGRGGPPQEAMFFLFPGEKVARDRRSHQPSRAG